MFKLESRVSLFVSALPWLLLPKLLTPPLINFFLPCFSFFITYTIDCKNAEAEESILIQ
jgi:hypothetical protein